MVDYKKECIAATIDLISAATDILDKADNHLRYASHDREHYKKLRTAVDILTDIEIDLDKAWRFGNENE